MMRPAVALLSALVLATTLTACGGGTTTVKAGENKTVGQELLDLQKAKESGAITDKEYAKMKDKILRNSR